MKMTGMSAVRWSAFIRRHTSKPSIPGITTSSSAISGGVAACRRSNASSPLLATMTEHFGVSSATRTLRLIGSSSRREWRGMSMDHISNLVVSSARSSSSVQVASVKSKRPVRRATSSAAAAATSAPASNSQSFAASAMAAASPSASFADRASMTGRTRSSGGRGVSTVRARRSAGKRRRRRRGDLRRRFGDRDGEAVDRRSDPIELQLRRRRPRRRFPARRPRAPRRKRRRVSAAPFRLLGESPGDRPVLAGDRPLWILAASSPCSATKSSSRRVNRARLPLTCRSAAASSK